MPLRKKKKKKLLSCSPTASQTCDRIRNSLCCWVYSSTLVDKNQHSVQGIFVTFFRVISVHLFSPLILNQTKKNNNTLWGTRFLSSAYIKPNESGKMAPTQQPHPVEHNANPQTSLSRIFLYPHFCDAYYQEESSASDCLKEDVLQALRKCI